MRDKERIDALERMVTNLELRLDRERDRHIERTARRSAISPMQHHREVREAVATALWIAAIELVPIEDRIAWVESTAARLNWIKGWSNG